MAFRSTVLDQDGRDWIDQPDIMPFPAGSRFHNFIMEAVIAFHSPVLHQHRLAIREADHLRLTADKIREQATRASVAVFIMLSFVHCGNAEAQEIGPRDGQVLPSRG